MGVTCGPKSVSAYSTGFMLFTGFTIGFDGKFIAVSKLLYIGGTYEEPKLPWFNKYKNSSLLIVLIPLLFPNSPEKLISLIELLALGVGVFVVSIF